MRARRLLVACVLGFAAAFASAAPVTSDDLVKVPADAVRYTILSTGGTHGSAARWATADGVRWSRDTFNLRGQLFDSDAAIRVDRDGTIARLVVRGFRPSGDIGETFEVRDGQARWTSPVDKGAVAYERGALYNSSDGPIGTWAELYEAVLARPDRTATLLPGGRVRAEAIATQVVGSGPATRTITAWAFTGLYMSPVVAWFDADAHLFAAVGPLGFVREGYEEANDRLIKAQDEALARRSPLAASALFEKLSVPVAFVHVRAFVGAGVFEDDRTILVERGTITRVGPSDGAALPAGTRVIDGQGRTLVPGLWDAHMHFGDDASGPLLLSLGITSARDPGNNDALTLARRERRAKGELLMPRVYPSVMIDGRGPETAQYASVATSLDESLAIVRKAKADGFTAIKIYGTFDARWVAPTAAEAHRLGLHVHGHLPVGMRTSQAIDAGYDEITHINFVMMEAMPDDVVKRSNTIERMTGPGRYAKDVDLDAEPMKGLIATMAKKRIAVDPTLVVFEGTLGGENGEPGPSYVPYMGRLPPAFERAILGGGVEPPKGVTRADFRASQKRFGALVLALQRAGVPIVAGTDGTGLELVRELELYVEAGMTPAEALATATRIPAEVVGVSDRTGAIRKGMAADLVLVEGDPSKDIGALRQTRLVLMDGGIMDADALRAASGISGRPR